MIRAVGVDQGEALRADGSAYYVAEVESNIASPPARRRSARRQHGRGGSRRLGRHSSAGHARPRTIDRREGDCRLPGPRRPAAAPAEGLGRAVQRQSCPGSDAFFDFKSCLVRRGRGRGQARAQAQSAAGDRGPATADAEERGDRRRPDRRHRHPDRAADRLRPAHDAAPSIRRARTDLRHYTPTEAGAPLYPELGEHRRGRAGHGLRPGSRRRPDHRRLLSLRPEAAPRDDPQGLRRRSEGMAPRRAPLRRRLLHGRDQAARPFRQPHRLCRRNGIAHAAGEAHRDHELGRHRPQLSHPGRGHRHQPAAFAGRPAHRLHELRRRNAACPGHGRRRQQRPSACAIAVDELLAALLARRTLDRLLHGRRRQYRHLRRRCRWRLSAAADDHAGHRHLAELLAGRLADRLRKRPRRAPSRFT